MAEGDGMFPANLHPVEEMDDTDEELSDSDYDSDASIPAAAAVAWPLDPSPNFNPLFFALPYAGGPPCRRNHAQIQSPVACGLEWLPDSLLNSAYSAVAGNFDRLKWVIREALPLKLQFGVLRKLYTQGRLCYLSMEFCDLKVFARSLLVRDQRYELHQMFQATLDHGSPHPHSLLTAYFQHVQQLLSSKRRSLKECQEHINLGFQLGGFLLEAGWCSWGDNCLLACLGLCEDLCRICDTKPNRIHLLECCYRLLEAYNGNCQYMNAEKMMVRCQTELDALGETVEALNLPNLYTQFSLLHFNTSRYEAATEWALNALRALTPETPITTVMEGMRQASKVLVVRRQFKQAELLIKHVVCLAKTHFDGGKRAAGALQDFGFYLMNVDLSEAAAKVYQMALDFRQAEFGGQNLRVAQAHEDLAYALYVQEYSSGNFQHAKDHSEKAIGILQSLLPDNHLLLASSRRVKALILEEIAIDSQDKELEKQLLQEADELHLSALALCKRIFGEDNIQTAKHYGNLGRLYQSMHRFEEAESMHRRAIGIKERLLGEQDYEVALSIGHLASLYNYDMTRYRDAEALYLRSIDIGKKLFGEAYSGLEYDYRGLMHCYVALGEGEQADRYVSQLHRWKVLRDRELAKMTPDMLWQSLTTPRPTAVVLEDFFKKYN